MAYASIVVLLQDTTRISSYLPLFEKAAQNAQEEATLDVIILKPVSQLVQLDSILQQTYNSLEGVLERLDKRAVKTYVLFNGHHIEIAKDWDLLILDSSDEDFEELGFPESALDILNVQREEVEPKTIDSEDDFHEDQYDVVAVGGTFDHFHIGHKILLSAAAYLTKDTLIVGITDSKLLENKKYKEFLQTYDYRQHQTLNFLRRIKPSIKINPYAISDICGPTGYIENIDTIVVSKETLKGAEFINKFRTEKGMSELIVRVINVIGGEEENGFQDKLSSTQLRKEEYDNFHSK